MPTTTCTDATHDHDNAFALRSALENEAQELADESGAAAGDARRCPRHPHVKTSSDDGMHDGLCGACESENDEPEDLEAAAAYETNLAARKVAARAAMDAAAEGDAYIPF